MRKRKRWMVYDKSGDKYIGEVYTGDVGTGVNIRIQDLKSWYWTDANRETCCTFLRKARQIGAKINKGCLT